MQDKLVFKRKKHISYGGSQAVIKVDVKNYDKISDIAFETGKSLKAVTDEMIKFAYENATYDDCCEQEKADICIEPRKITATEAVQIIKDKCGEDVEITL